jgi:hypothetical protein
VVGQPHKLFHLAKLVGLLYVSPEASAEASEPDPLGHQILQHCWKCCKETTEDSDLRYLRPWVLDLNIPRNILNSVQIHFFSHTTVLKIVAIESFLQLIQNISLAFDELGATTKRLSIVTACILDSLIRVRHMIDASKRSDPRFTQAGEVLWQHDATATEGLVKNVSANLSEASASSELITPFLFLHAPSELTNTVSEVVT